MSHENLANKPKWVKIGTFYYRVTSWADNVVTADPQRLTEEDFVYARYYEEIVYNDAAHYWFLKFKDANDAVKRYKEMQLEAKLKRQNNLLSRLFKKVKHIK